MADGTKIEWTDATWNIVNGCSVTSPGCTHCYAMRLAGTRLKHVASREGLTAMSKAGPVWTGETRFNEPVLFDPIRWKRPRRIFVCAHGDLFHESVPDEWIERVFAVMVLAPQHQFQVLTKRAERMRAYLSTPGVVRRICSIASELRYQAAPDPDRWPNKFHAFLYRSAAVTAWTHRGGCAAELFERKEPDRDWPSWVPWPLPNVWQGVSVEDQKRADERIPHLLATPAAVRWLSCEPLLGPVDLSRISPGQRLRGAVSHEHVIHALQGGIWDQLLRVADEDGPQLDWVVAGGESGPGARPMHPDWARSLRDQCQAAGVPFLFKQWGEWLPCEVDNASDGSGTICYPDDGSERDDVIPDGKKRPITELGRQDFWRVGKKAAGRLLDGVQHDGFPA